MIIPKLTKLISIKFLKGYLSGAVCLMETGKKSTCFIQK